MSHSSLSNSKLVAIEEDEDGCWHHFEPTPQMSPYLLTFFCSKFDRTTKHTDRGVEISVVVPTGVDMTTGGTYLELGEPALILAT